MHTWAHGYQAIYMNVLCAFAFDVQLMWIAPARPANHQRNVQAIFNVQWSTKSAYIFFCLNITTASLLLWKLLLPKWGFRRLIFQHILHQISIMVVQQYYTWRIHHRSKGAKHTNVLHDRLTSEFILCLQLFHEKHHARINSVNAVESAYSGKVISS